MEMESEKRKAFFSPSLALFLIGTSFIFPHKFFLSFFLSRINLVFLGCCVFCSCYFLKERRRLSSLHVIHLSLLSRSRWMRFWFSFSAYKQSIFIFQFCPPFLSFLPFPECQFPEKRKYEMNEDGSRLRRIRMHEDGGWRWRSSGRRQKW